MTLNPGNGFSQKHQLCLLQFQEKEPRDRPTNSVRPRTWNLPFLREGWGSSKRGHGDNVIILSRKEGVASPN